MALSAAGAPAGVPLPLVGACIAVSGNILIALALNVQKLAHTRLQRRQSHQPPSSQLVDPPILPPSPPAGRDDLAMPASYGTFANPVFGRSRAASLLPPLAEGEPQARGEVQPRVADPAAGEAEAEHAHPHASGVSYLRSRLWWTGIGLMTLGEAGNFISYGFAPASLIAPLGSAALLANVFLAPMVVGEDLGMTDVVGAALCALGAGGVVWSVPSRGTDPLSLDALVHALRQRAFVIYCLVDIGVAAVLSLLSLTPVGDTFLLVDLGVCACLGSLTVLTTKSLSGLLAGGAEVGGGLSGIVAALNHPFLLALLAVLAGTAVGQVVFLNRALQRFDASRVIPTHFTLFTISAILGSAVLFRDFARWPPSRVVCFLLACATTFGGVYVLAREKGLPPDHETEVLPRPHPTRPHSPFTPASPHAPEPAPSDSSRPVAIQPHGLRPRLRAIATDTALLPPLHTHDAGYKDGPATPSSARARRYLTGPALALSTGHYLLLPLDSGSSTRGPEQEHPALTQPIYMSREAHSELGHQRSHWSPHLVRHPSLAFPSTPLSRSFDQRPSWADIFHVSSSPREHREHRGRELPAPHDTRDIESAPAAPDADPDQERHHRPDPSDA